MIIAVTAKEPSLDSLVDPRFGRCAYFLLVETNDFSFEAVKNPTAGHVWMCVLKMLLLCHEFN